MKMKYAFNNGLKPEKNEIKFEKYEHMSTLINCMKDRAFDYCVSHDLIRSLPEKSPTVEDVVFEIIEQDHQNMSAPKDLLKALVVGLSKDIRVYVLEENYLTSITITLHQEKHNFLNFLAFEGKLFYLINTDGKSPVG